MIWKIAAGAVVVAHLAFVLWVVCGGLAVLWRRRLAWVHLPAAAWGVGIELAGGICPLTPLENRLRVAAGLAGYEGDFLESYLLPVLYPEGLTREVQVWLGLATLAFNLAVYAVVVARWRRQRRGRPAC